MEDLIYLFTQNKLTAANYSFLYTAFYFLLWLPYLYQNLDRKKKKQKFVLLYSAFDHFYYGKETPAEFSS